MAFATSCACHLVGPPYRSFLKSTDYIMIEIREEIYRQVLLENCYLEMGELKPDKNLQSINDSDNESGNGDLFAKDQRGADNILPRINAEFYGHQGIPPIEQAGKTESGPGRDIDEEVSIEEETVCKRRRESEVTGNIRDTDMESKCNGHVLAPVTTTRHHERANENVVALAILRTCRQIYAEASPLFYSMLEVLVTPEDVVDLHVEEEIIQRRANMRPIQPICLFWFLEPLNGEGIFETLGWGSLLDFAAFSKVERIQFDADYNFHRIDKSPSLYVDENFYTSPNDEAELISFMKRTWTMENFVSLLATLPRLRQLSLTLVIEVNPNMDLPPDDEDDDEADSLILEKMKVANERATELFIECGMLDPLRKLSNVQKFDLEVLNEDRKTTLDDPAIMVPNPKHARMAQELKEAIEHNWVARNTIH